MNKLRKRLSMCLGKMTVTTTTLPMCRLKKIVDETGCKIVLSSSWRKTPQGKNYVNQQLRRSTPYPPNPAAPPHPSWADSPCACSYAIPSVVGCTRIRYDEYQRHEDIMDYVDRNMKSPSDRWIAIDDLPMPQLGEHYIQTAPDTGLTDSSVAKAIRVLNQ